MRAHGRLRGRHQGSESCWEAIRALSYRAFCPFDGRRVSLGYLAAGFRYTTRCRDGTVLCPAQLPGALDPMATNDVIGINSDEFFSQTEILRYLFEIHPPTFSALSSSTPVIISLATSVFCEARVLVSDMQKGIITCRTGRCLLLLSGCLALRAQSRYRVRMASAVR